MNNLNDANNSREIAKEIAEFYDLSTIEIIIMQSVANAILSLKIEPKLLIKIMEPLLIMLEMIIENLDSENQK